MFIVVIVIWKYPLIYICYNCNNNIMFHTLTLLNDGYFISLHLISISHVISRVFVLASYFRFFMLFCLCNRLFFGIRILLGLYGCLLIFIKINYLFLCCLARSCTYQNFYTTTPISSIYHHLMPSSAHLQSISYTDH